MPIFAGYTKVLVGTGLTSSGRIDSFEILDLEGNGTSCRPALPNYPMAVSSATAGLGQDEKVVLCGGFDGSSRRAECYALLQGSTWQSIPSLRQAIALAQFSPSPFANESGVLVLSAGFSGARYSNSVQILRHGKWESWSGLPLGMKGHCMLLMNSSALMTIGGYNNSHLANTFVLNSLSSKQVWIPGPSMNRGRYFHACARIR